MTCIELAVVAGPTIGLVIGVHRGALWVVPYGFAGAVLGFLAAVVSIALFAGLAFLYGWLFDREPARRPSDAWPPEPKQPNQE